MKKASFYVILALSVFLASEIPAHAYIDGGTGSYLMQIAIAALWAIGFTFRTSIQRIMAKIKKTSKDQGYKK